MVRRQPQHASRVPRHHYRTVEMLLKLMGFARAFRALKGFKAFKVLGTRQSWTGLGLLFVLAFIWLLGDFLGISMTTRITITIAILASAVIILLYQQHRRAQDAAHLERSLHAQSEEQRLSVRPEKQ